MTYTMSVYYRLEEQEKLRAEIEAENKELRSLNMQLQQQLLKALKSSSTAKCSGKEDSPPQSSFKPANKIQIKGIALGLGKTISYWSTSAVIFEGL